MKNLRFRIRKKLKILRKVSLIKEYSQEFNVLCQILNKIFKKNVELKLTRLHYPYKNSNILVNLLGLMVNKIKFRLITRRLFKFAIVKSLNKFKFKKKKRWNQSEKQCKIIFLKISEEEFGEYIKADREKD